jgi:hypothetical protein
MVIIFSEFFSPFSGRFSGSGLKNIAVDVGLCSGLLSAIDYVPEALIFFDFENLIVESYMDGVFTTFAVSTPLGLFRVMLAVSMILVIWFGVSVPTEFCPNSPRLII